MSAAPDGAVGSPARASTIDTASGSSARWLADDLLEVGGITFATGPRDDGSIPIIKPPDLVRRYLDLLAAERPEVIVELGTKGGGSAALMAAVARPTLLLTIDLAPEVPPALVALRDHPDLGSRLQALAGVDQADAATLGRCVDEARAGRPLDLVVDDASHILSPTRTSFGVLFPRLRPGGLLIVEDWSSEAGIGAALAAVLPPSDPEWPERLALVRALLLRLNQPGDALPLAATEALGAAHREQPPSTDGGGFGAVLLALIQAGARADLDALRTIAVDDLPRPLVDLAVELSMVAATRPDVVASVEVSSEWLAVRRGPAELSEDGCDLSSLWHDHFGYLR